MNPRVNDISDRYSSWFRFVIVIGDLLLCNLVFWLAFRYGNSAGTSTQLQSQLLISAIWYACIINGGIILHIKKTRKVQIVMLMLRNVVLFAILAEGVELEINCFHKNPSFQSVQSVTVYITVIISYFSPVYNRDC